MTAPTHNPVQRIRAIEGTLRCFTLGWLSFIPLVGLAFALLTLDSCSTVRKQFSDEWNPAERYLVVAYWLAWCGIVLWLATLALSGSLLLKYYQVV